MWFPLASLVTLSCCNFASAQIVINALFVGSSFTHGNAAPVLNFNSANVTDANGTGYGGVPGIFKRLIDDHPDIGNDFNVTIEAVNGTNLAWHAANRAYIFRQPHWHIIVLQEDSITPLPPSRGGNMIGFSNGLRSIINIILETRSELPEVVLFENWARPDKVYPSGSPYSSLRQMQNDLYASYYAQATAYGFGIARVGESFMQAVAAGYADSNPYDTTNATVNLWAADHYRPSKYGSYLAALELFYSILDIGAEEVPTGPGSAAAQLGISSAIAQQLVSYALIR
ncbi:hypothetical protein BKA62DRAFT_720315 [Auriculariales sp. MPI-PUGE-AT-0066]|nr:hypothetical protein BKA62DRAFT_720315 [Auriculariales sp. MPI-PUGE-AT-0066]